MVDINQILKKNNIEILNNIDIIGFDLYEKKFVNLIEIVEYFINSYSSMVSIDTINYIAYFKINNKAIGNLNNFKYKIKNFYSKNKNFITLKKRISYKDNIIIIPTYKHHFNRCRKLLNSIHNNILDLKNINVFIILSSIEETKEFIHLLYSDNYIKFKLNILIFDVEYTNMTKFNYQCFKKFYGLLKLNYKYCFMLDSDFSFIKKTYIIRDIQKYKNKMFLNTPIINLDKNVLTKCNSVLQSKFQYFPLESPWIFEKEKILKLNEKINIKSLFSNKNRIFEIILYRLFLLQNYRKELEIIHITQPGFSHDFDKKSKDFKKNEYVVAAYKKNNITEKSTLQIHNDRTK